MKIKCRLSLLILFFKNLFILFTWLHQVLVKAYGTLVSQPGIEPVSPALQAGLLTTGLPGKSPLLILLIKFVLLFSNSSQFLSVEQKSVGKYHTWGQRWIICLVQHKPACWLTAESLPQCCHHMALAYCGVHKRDWHCKRLTGFIWQGQVSGWHAIKWLEDRRESVVGGHLRFLALDFLTVLPSDLDFRGKKFYLVKWGCSLHGRSTTATLGRERRIGLEEKHALSTRTASHRVGDLYQFFLSAVWTKRAEGRLDYAYLFTHLFIHLFN